MPKIDPDRSEEGGNTQNPPSRAKPKQVPLRKNHFLTYFYEDIKEIDPIVTVLKKHFYKGKVQSEICPTTGRPHIHASLWGKEKKRDTAFGLSKKIHWEALKDEDDVANYSNKEASHDGLYRTSWGFPKPIKVIEELYPWQAEIEKIILEEPDDRSIYWYWDTKGNIGKSAFIKYMVVKHGVLFCSSGKYADLINLVFNANMDDCNCVIFDIPRANKGAVSYAALEAIKNGLVCNTKYETGSKAFNSPHIFIFANFPPENPEQLSSDRWKITCLDKEGECDIKEDPNDGP